MKILIIKNKGVKKGFIENQIEEMTEYFSEKAPEKFGVSPRYFEFDIIESDLDIKLVNVGTNSQGKSAYGADDVKRHIINKVEQNKYHAVYFVYDAEPMFSKTKYNAPFTYNKNLFNKTAMIQVPDNAKDSTFMHEWIHAEVKLQARVGNDVSDQMDRTLVNGEWRTYYKNHMPTALGGNFNVTLDNLEDVLSDITDESFFDDEVVEASSSNYVPFSQMTAKDNIPQFIFVHHLGGSDAKPLADSSNQTFEDVQDWHVNGLGWQNFGYHYMIEKDGDLKTGRPELYQGAHVKGYNYKSLGIVLAGNFDVTLPTEAQVETLRELLKELTEKYNIPASRVLPHRSKANKSCYGNLLTDDWAANLLKEEVEEVEVIDDTEEEVITEPEVCVEKPKSVFQLIIELIKAIFKKQG